MVKDVDFLFGSGLDSILPHLRNFEQKRSEESRSDTFQFQHIIGIIRWCFS